MGLELMTLSLGIACSTNGASQVPQGVFIFDTLSTVIHMEFIRENTQIVYISNLFADRTV